MKRKRFSVEQVVGVLKQAEAGVPVTELIRKVGISEQTFYRWKKPYTGLEVDQVVQLKQLQEENARRKRLVADLALDKVVLEDVLGKKTLKPSRRHPAVEHLCGSYFLPSPTSHPDSLRPHQKNSWCDVGTDSLSDLALAGDVDRLLHLLRTET